MISSASASSSKSYKLINNQQSNDSIVEYTDCNCRIWLIEAISIQILNVMGWYSYILIKENSLNLHSNWHQKDQIDPDPLMNSKNLNYTSNILLLSSSKNILFIQENLSMRMQMCVASTLVWSYVFFIL